MTKQSLIPGNFFEQHNKQKKEEVCEDEDSYQAAYFREQMAEFEATSKAFGIVTDKVGNVLGYVDQATGKVISGSFKTAQGWLVDGISYGIEKTGEAVKAAIGEENAGKAAAYVGKKFNVVKEFVSPVTEPIGQAWSGYYDSFTDGQKTFFGFVEGVLQVAVVKDVTKSTVKAVISGVDNFVESAGKMLVKEDLGDVVKAKSSSVFDDGAFTYNKKGGLIGTRKNPKEILGDLENPIVKHELSKMPDKVVDERIDYRKKIAADLENFQKGSAKFFSGPLKEDMVLLNFFDSSKTLGDGRTTAWATNPKVVEDLIGKPYSKINAADMDKICDHLGLVRPDWGARNAVNVIKIEKGTHVDFVSGAARFQKSDLIHKKFDGGGFQIRFRDFDPKWIKETFDIE